MKKLTVLKVLKHFTVQQKTATGEIENVSVALRTEFIIAKGGPFVNFFRP